MTVLRERPEVRPPEVKPPVRPPTVRPSRRALIGWTVAGILVVAGIVALVVWLANRDGTAEPVESAVPEVATEPAPEAALPEPAAAPTLFEVPTGDAAGMETIAAEGRIPEIPLSGDAYLMELIARRAGPTLIEPQTGDAYVLEMVGTEVEIATITDPSTLRPSAETGDAQVLEQLGRLPAMHSEGGFGTIVPGGYIIY